MQFDFGQNWKDFSANALTEERIEQSFIYFKKLTTKIDLKDKSFLDIGFGQGLGVINASKLGANVTGNDINPKCYEALEINKKRFPEIAEKNIPLVIGSILEKETINKLANTDHTIEGKFDIVHSWGVLHHTGEMWHAIDNSISLVSEKGYYIIAIYNKHWSSLPWLFIKWFYNIMPNFIKKLMIYLFIPVIYTAKFIVTGKSPTKTKRGMNFYYDIIDWVGGYPYEYGSTKEMIDYVEKKGFKCIDTFKAGVPTGCNEFVFEKV